MRADRKANILGKLSGGDCRSIGRVDEVVADVLAKPALFEALIDGMSVADPLVRMRAADAVEKITAKHADWLTPYQQRLLGPVAAIEQQEVRWHVAQQMPRLALTAKERSKAVAILLGYENPGKEAPPPARARLTRPRQTLLQPGRRGLAAIPSHSASR